jgi:uncharacterized membrane protein HdeD (DUF308 family)
MNAPLTDWSNGMTTYIQRSEMAADAKETPLPRPFLVALTGGILMSGLLLLLSLPLLASIGLWLLGIALALVGYALIAYHQFNTAVWDTAIAGQVLGMLGIALLFGSSLLA